jgi:3-hydroxyisobutyrate dehydrogenase
VHLAILGLGEAGRRYAEDLLAAGWKVTAYDPAPVPAPDGVLRVASGPEAVAEAEIVLSLTGAGVAERAAAQVAPAMRERTCFADFNSASPATKRAVARAFDGTGVRVADVAVLAPVPRRGAATPLLVSGPGAQAVASALRAAGAPVDVLEAEVGAAAGRKLLRSVFMKGLAATVLEAVSAGAAAGCEEWIRDQIAGELGPDGRALVERLIDGTRAHAARRVHEMRASREYLRELGANTAVSDATLSWLEELAGQPIEE